MNFKSYNFNKLEKEIKDESIYSRSRKKQQYFIRNRKITSQDLIYYSLNNRGKTTKMELYDYIELLGYF